MASKKISELDEATSLNINDLVEVSIDNGDTTFTSKKIRNPLLSKVKQVVSITSSTVHSGTGYFPLDDTIPQNTEGNYASSMDLTITPTSTDSTLIFNGKIVFGLGGYITYAVFVDSTANAINTGFAYFDGAGSGICIPINFIYQTFDTSSHTFKIRFGKAAAQTSYFNKFTSSHYYSTSLTSNWTCIEV